MVASTTAGKYGVKNTSGRIWASPHRAAVLPARQRIAKPTASSSEGWVNPCQPRLNSSINFASIFPGIVTSRDQRIQNMAEHRAKPAVSARRWSQPCHAGGNLAACTASRAAEIVTGKTNCRTKQGEAGWDGWTARLRSSRARPAASACAPRRSSSPKARKSSLPGAACPRARRWPSNSARPASSARPMSPWKRRCRR